jgi:hypothetical protein
MIINLAFSGIPLLLAVLEKNLSWCSLLYSTIKQNQREPDLLGELHSLPGKFL